MGARAMLFETRFTPSAEQARSTLPQIKTFVAIGENRPDWALDYEALLAGASSAEPDVEIEEHDPYYFNLTSGTTGLPKSYLLSHFNNCAIGPMFEAFDTTSQDVLMTVFPAFGRVGFAWIAAGLTFGARNVLMDFHPAETLRRIESERVTLMNLGSDHGRDDARRSEPAEPQPRVPARARLRRRHVPRALAGARRRRALPADLRILRDAGNGGADHQHARRPEGASRIRSARPCASPR